MVSRTRVFLSPVGDIFVPNWRHFFRPPRFASVEGSTVQIGQSPHQLLADIFPRFRVQPADRGSELSLPRAAAMLVTDDTPVETRSHRIDHKRPVAPQSVARSQCVFVSASLCLD